MNKDLKAHWEKVYQTKSFEELSWFQEKPETSIQFFEKLNLPKTDSIIDMGSGESRFVDYLLDKGYEHITLVDISEEALSKTKARLGEKGKSVKYIIADAGTFKAIEKYDFWHDRATFHFLTEITEIEHYTQNICRSLNAGAHFLIGTFAEGGPKKCSGLEITQYSADDLSEVFARCLTQKKSNKVNHTTSDGTVQKFTFCLFKYDG
ncbi:trans-aconitate 2-methyltransferase [Emticicia sp. C21]|uniref:class I SAM-dependent methyltransferase n=1 Tax=Emticicia sp. C21 TaxID=2302915 RepID=UPI000E34CA95|nr:class I SAM-dependent methyltransferase [Emticicia sp. C21]RFS17693.1 class I SAM-dependent methyltransferase [Emticicia sp. C21]